MDRIKQKLLSLPPLFQNNARSIFLSDYKRGQKGWLSKLLFGLKWDLASDYSDLDHIPGYDSGEAELNHNEYETN